MTDSAIERPVFPPDLHTDFAQTLYMKRSKRQMSWEEYLSQTVPVMVRLQSQGKPLEYLPVVLGATEFYEVLLQGLIEMFPSQSIRNIDELQLRVRWCGSGATSFDGQDTMELNRENLDSTLRLLKQRQGNDMLLLEVGGSSLAGQGGPSGDQKVSKREGKRKHEGQNAAERKTGQRLESSSHSDDVTMKDTTPPFDVPNEVSMMEAGSGSQPSLVNQRNTGRSHDQEKGSSSQAARDKGVGRDVGGKTGRGRP